MSTVATKKAKDTAGKRRVGSVTPAPEWSTPGTLADPSEREMRVVDLPLADVLRDGGNHRLKRPDDGARLAELAESIRRNGQQSPVRVADLLPLEASAGKGLDPRYLLVYGFRRCAAAELAGLATVRAEVVLPPLTPDGRLDEAAVQAQRAAENLDRLDLNPVEEAEAVAAMLAAVGGDTFEAAARLGKSETWVRDRGYLARLCPEVRGWVADGTLKLKFAREIAKLGDHEDQIAIAEDTRVPEDGRSSWQSDSDLPSVRRRVAERMRSLKIVPWPLEAAFDGKEGVVGPCAGCPFNSATDRNLFEHDEMPPEDGHCLKGDCFERKQELCRAAVDKAVASIVKAGAEGATSEGAEAALSRAKVDYVKPATVARAAKKSIDGPSAGGRAPGVAKGYEDRVRDAEYAHLRAMREWGDAQADRVLAAAADVPGRRLMLILAERLWGQYEIPNEEMDKRRPSLEALFDPGAWTPRLIEQEDKIKLAHWEDLSLIGDSNSYRDWVAARWGVALDPPPDKASFMPEKPSEPAAKKKGKPKKSKAAPVVRAERGAGHGH